MIEITNIQVSGWEASIRGMRNPMNSWDKIDSDFTDPDIPHLGDNDLTLMYKLVEAGTEHAKFLRMINVTMDINAPLYWWKEFDTYKVATVSNSCSTMHKIHSRELTIDDFSHDQLSKPYIATLESLIECINVAREQYKLTGVKTWWWQIIQLLPSSYNQKRTVQLNYDTLRRMYFQRRDHKLDEWREFCETILTLPEHCFIKEV